MQKKTLFILPAYSNKTQQVILFSPKVLNFSFPVPLIHVIRIKLLDLTVLIIQEMDTTQFHG